jgi:uncharacterized protein YyaL (SSP411 family)
MNRLSLEKSAYLKHAATQKIDWYPWCEEAFEKARKDDKPLFLSTGAVWCHWCHVMAKECFQDEEIIKLLNRHFINIKLDRDERPDIDRLYQHAVAAMGSGGGWPLTVFLTHDKKPFFGGTYFPPEDRYGRPGFKKVLKSIVGLYHLKRKDISPYSDKLIDVIKQEPLRPGEIDETLVIKAVETVLSDFDPQNGGFGTAPKFPMPGAIELLINKYILTGKKPVGFAVRKTLDSMAKGGFYDQIGGGFHRYSTDQEWIVPHFEKMADDNAWLLRNYILAYSVFKDEKYKTVAEEIIRFMREVLSDGTGGFYASQDADVTPDDEGGYFTWTDQDLRRVLNDEEYKILSLYLSHDKGSMHHDHSKRVLFVGMDESEIADKLGKDTRDIIDCIKSGKEKLFRERNTRTTPFIDRSLYTSLNGMLITSYLLAYRVLGDGYLKRFAMKSLDKVLGKYFTGSELYHSEGVKAMLEDYVYIGEALIAAYEVTGDKQYVSSAEKIMDMCIERLWDNAEGGFFETDSSLLGVRMKGIEDISHPSPNSSAIMLLMKLSNITGREEYLQRAEMALKAFSSRASGQGIISGYFFASLDAFFNLLKLGIHTADREMVKSALSFLSPFTSIVYGDEKGCIIPCMKGICYEPLKDVKALSAFLDNKKYLESPMKS